MRYYRYKMQSAYLPSQMSVIFRKKMCTFQLDHFPEAFRFMNEIDRGGLFSPNNTTFEPCAFVSHLCTYCVCCEIEYNEEHSKQFFELKNQSFFSR